MAQAAFPFDSMHSVQAMTRLDTPGAQAQAASAHSDPIAFEIGWDHAHHRLTPPLAHLQAESPVQHGWRAGRVAFGLRSLRATEAVRRWLDLRLQAWMLGSVFEGVQVTPQFLRQIEVERCPITRELLVPAAGSDQQAVVVRLFSGAGFAAGNLAMISTAAAARSRDDWRAAWACAEACDPRATASETPGLGSAMSGARGSTNELGDAAANDAPASHALANAMPAAAWRRLAILQSLTTPLPHSTAAALPLCVLPPNRLRVQNPIQAVQVMLTRQFMQAGYARRLVALAALMPNAELRQAFQIFMHTLLARRLAIGQALDGPAMRSAMEDTWCDELVLRRWQRLSTRLTATECEQLLRRCSQRGLIARGCEWLSVERATEGWALASAGQVQAPGDGDKATPDSAAHTPGSLRSSGSQKPTHCNTVSGSLTAQ